MKETAISLTLGFATLFTVSAQDTLQVQNDPDALKARRRSFATELNVNPFKGELSLNNTFNQLKFRLFPSDQFALRLAFTASTVKNEHSSATPYGTNPSKYEETKKAMTVGANFGFEKHFAGTRRLSPYIGAEAALAVKSASNDIITSNAETRIKGAWQQNVAVYPNPSYPNNPVYVASYTERAFTRYGVNLITGFDFYMAKHIYFGYEVTFGFAKTQYKDIDISTLYTNGGGNPSGNPNTERDDKDFSVGPTLLNGVRIGYVF